MPAPHTLKGPRTTSVTSDHIHTAGQQAQREMLLILREKGIPLEPLQMTPEQHELYSSLDSFVQLYTMFKDDQYVLHEVCRPLIGEGASAQEVINSFGYMVTQHWITLMGEMKKAPVRIEDMPLFEEKNRIARAFVAGLCEAAGCTPPVIARPGHPGS